MKCPKCQTRVYITDRLLIDDYWYHKSCVDSLTTDGVVVDDNDSHTTAPVCDTVVVDDIDLTIVDNNNRQNDIQVIQIRDSRQTTDDNDNCLFVDHKPSVSDVSADGMSADHSMDVNIGSECDVKALEDSYHKLNISFDDNSEDRQCLSGTDVEIVPKVDFSTVDALYEELFGKSDDQNSNDMKTSDEEFNTSEEELEEIKISETKSTELESKPSVVVYPDDKNPFDEEEEDNEEMAKELYPDEKNPFGDEESDEEVNKCVDNSNVVIRVERQTSSSDQLNPFGDDFDDEDNVSTNTPKPMPRQILTVSTPSPVVSPTSSLRGPKKRTAPTPPSANTAGIPHINSSCSLNSSVAAISDDTSRRDSLMSNLSSDITSSATSSRTPTPLPRHRIKSKAEVVDIQQNGDKNLDKNLDKNSNKSEISLKTNDSDSDLSKTKLKKRLAPPIPAIKRIVKSSLAEIDGELNSIGDQLPVVDEKGRQLEQILMSRPPPEESQTNGVSKDDKVLNDFLATARERCRLGRRQKELMYMKREHKLEEIQADIEYQMRCVISKQSAQKTPEDLKCEEELLKRLVEIIEERNEMVENMIKDENKEVEEYQRLIAKVLPQKPDLKPKPKQEISGSEAKPLKAHKPMDELKKKLKDEKKKLKKFDKMAKSSDNGTKRSEQSEGKEKSSKSLKHLSLKSTLKPLKRSLGLKTNKEHKSADNCPTPDVANGSTNAISDKKILK